MNDRECINIYRELETCKKNIKMYKSGERLKCKPQCEYAIGRSIIWGENCNEMWHKMDLWKKKGKVIAYEEYSSDGMLSAIKLRGKDSEYYEEF